MLMMYHELTTLHYHGSLVVYSIKLQDDSKLLLILQFLCVLPFKYLDWKIGALHYNPEYN